MENNNKNSWIWVVAVIVVVLIIFAFYASYKANHPSYTNETTTGQTTQTNTNTMPLTIDVKHQYKNGTHTYVGLIDVPTPCYTLSNSVVKDPNDTKKFTIAFVTTNTQTAGQACAQVVTSRNFKVTFTGPQNAIVSGTLDGKPVVFNVFEVNANQNIDTVDINIKG